MEQLIDEKILESFKKKAEKEGIDFQLGAVFYTDGGGDVNLRVASYGLHGYLFAYMDSKTGAGSATKGYTLTDVGYIPNEQAEHPINIDLILNQKTGKGEQASPDVSITPIAYFTGFAGLEDATNNIGETVGLTKALEISTRLYTELGVKRFHYVLDSKYVIRATAALSIYAENGWKRFDGSPVANKEYHEVNIPLIEQLAQPEVRATIQWTRGHRDNFGNIQADLLAKNGLNAARNGHCIESTSVKPAKGFWTIKKENENPYLLDCFWYTQPDHPIDKTFDGKSVMVVGQHKRSDPERFCQPNSKDLYGVVAIDSIPEELLVLRQSTDILEEETKGFDYAGVYYIDINRAVDAANSQAILFEHRNALLKFNHVAKYISNVTKTPLCSKFHPQHLSVIGMKESFSQHQILLERVNLFLKGQTDKLPDHMVLTEFTDQAFETKEKKSKGGKETKTVTECILPNTPDIKVNAEIHYLNLDNVYKTTHFDFTLTYGITAPPKRVFSNLKDSKPRCFILTVHNPAATVQYYTVILDGDGNIGLWGNGHANIIPFYPNKE